MQETFTLSDNGTAGPIRSRGGPVTLQAAGDFGGGTAHIQIDAGAGFVSYDDSYLDDFTKVAIDVPIKGRVQVVLSGASSPDVTVVFNY